VCDWKTAATSDTERYARYFRGMLDRGIVLAPSQFEATFVGLTHTDADIDAMTEAAAQVLAGV
jgi:glutamate-1-semialdehyde 2,1-aminomutase